MDVTETQFDQLKSEYNIKPIYLSHLLKDQYSFVQEYQRVCAEMQIPVLLEQALTLRQDWYSTRIGQL